MTCRFNNSCLFFFADRTRSYLASVLRAGCLLSHCPSGPLMAGCYYCIFLSNLFRSCFVAVEFFTLAAGPVLDVSGFSARSILCFRLGQVMSFSCNYCFFLADLCLTLFIAEDFPALTAGPVLNVSGLCAGRGLRLCLGQSVPSASLNSFLQVPQVQ